MSIEQTTVRVYVKPATDPCKQCDLTLDAFKKAGVPVIVEDIYAEGNAEAAKALGLMSAPVVIAGDIQWAGFRPDLINELAARIGATS